MKVALLGAGHIGHTISHLLVNSGDYTVTVADQSQASLDKLGALKVNRVLIDTEKAGSIEAVIKGHDAVINALPYHLAVKVASAAKAVGC
ncbi:MAG: saccharopine dehydrogenase family protein, partial [Burkholderiales bacterium]